MAKIIHERSAKEVTKKVGEVNPNKEVLYEVLAGKLVETFGKDVLMVKKGSVKKLGDKGRMKTTRTGCEGLLFEYNGETVVVDITFKEDTFTLDDCVVEATYTNE